MAEIVKLIEKISLKLIALAVLAVVVVTFVLGTFIITPSVKGKTFTYHSYDIKADKDAMEDNDWEKDDIKDQEEEYDEYMKDEKAKIRFKDDEVHFLSGGKKNSEVEYEQKGKKIEFEDYDDDIEIKLKGNKLVMVTEDDGVKRSTAFKCGSFFAVRNVLIVLELLVLAAVVFVYKFFGSKKEENPVAAEGEDYIEYNAPVAAEVPAETVVETENGEE
ncbi:MAG: hypothetical protein Q4B31_03280 [Clostridia bacterium]|nr:hypothetical protein [Clostridia bacterium]